MKRKVSISAVHFVAVTSWLRRLLNMKKWHVASKRELIQRDHCEGQIKTS